MDKENYVETTFQGEGKEAILASIGMCDGKPDFSFFTVVFKSGEETRKLGLALVQMREGDEVMFTYKTDPLPEKSI